MTNQETNKMNNQIPIILEVGPDKAYGSGAVIKYATEYSENVEFPNTVTIVKFNDYYDKIAHVSVSHP